MRVIHCFRAPVGGLFRHVCDLVRGQRAAGLEVGVICDRTSGGPDAQAALDRLAPACALGVHRIRMARQPSVTDLEAALAIRGINARFAPDIIHGHGAKGGAYARIATWRTNPRIVYTPHGGSLHYEQSTLGGRMYIGLERALRQRTDGAIFESRFAQRAFERKVGPLACPQRVVANGLHEEEFERSEPSREAVDFLFVGELRKLKGIDVLVDAMALLRAKREATLAVVGGGPDDCWLRGAIEAAGLTASVSVSAPIVPARNAFHRGRTLVLPSRAESLPYVVLEAAAAGMPIIATDVGDLRDVFGPDAGRLVPPGDAPALAQAMEAAIDESDAARSASGRLRERVRTHYMAGEMVTSVLEFYRLVSNGPVAMPVTD